MIRMTAVTHGVSIALFACVSALPANVLAQGGSAGARPPAADAGAVKAAMAGGAAAAGAGSLDMRLWSFGDCDAHFPYVETPEHRECIRVVGSDEARDARAIYFCNLSHAKDPAEAARCKEAYFANKSEAEQEALHARMTNPVPGAAAAAPAPKRDKAAEIAALTRALKTLDPEEPAPAAAPAPEPQAAPAPSPTSGSIGNVLLGVGLLLLLAAIGMRYLRGAVAAQAALHAAPRKGSRPKAASGIYFAR